MMSAISVSVSMRDFSMRSLWDWERAYVDMAGDVCEDVLLEVKSVKSVEESK
jgi:hypothetical protein